jgi:hypothetical protein
MLEVLFVMVINFHFFAFIFFRKIHTGFNADPDLAFHLNADPDPGSQTNADPDMVPGQTLPSKKPGFRIRIRINFSCRIRI